MAVQGDALQVGEQVLLAGGVGALEGKPKVKFHLVIVRTGAEVTQRESSQVHAVMVRTALRFLWSFGFQKTTEQYTGKAKRIQTPTSNKYSQRNLSSLRGQGGCPALPEQGY